jgi:hypothetical protein
MINFLAAKTMERPQLFIKPRFNIDLLNERVSLLPVLCEVGLRFDPSERC